MGTLYNMIRKITFTLLTFILITNIAKTQIPNPALIGYWHNWNDVNAPYIQLDAIDNRYNVIEIAFAIPTSPSDMTMLFTPNVVSQNVLINKIQALQTQGKKILISIGGATTSIDLTTTLNKNAFVSSMTAIINTYGFDGIDIDIENGNSILISGGTIASPSGIAQVNLIDAIKQIMSNYRTSHSQKLLLTMAPETAYVQGGQSAFGNIWGGYLPIINGLRDSLDLLQVQLYNSGSMYGIDGNIYTQGTADFIIAMTDAVIKGFNTTGGTFAGLPASKVAVGLPACISAAGGGYVNPSTVITAINYLRGTGAQPGAYVLSNSSGYPSLRGMMTWSINWDAVSSCGSVYEYANNYQSVFSNTTSISNFDMETAISVFPNPTNGQFTISHSSDSATITVTDILGQEVFKTHTTQKNVNVQIFHNGIYTINVSTKQGTKTQKLIVNQ
jgi:chitinase